MPSYIVVVVSSRDKSRLSPPSGFHPNQYISENDTQAWVILHTRGEPSFLGRFVIVVLVMK